MIFTMSQFIETSYQQNVQSRVLILQRLQFILHHWPSFSGFI